jgi:cobalt-zinc-cadmium efflux system protein
MNPNHTDHRHSRHHHSPVALENMNKAFYLGIILNTIFTIIEFVVGYANDSLALLADASHNLSDVASLIISLVGMKLTQKAATLTYTYGYKKASILASLINAALLMAVVFSILKEAVERIYSPPEVSGSIVMITAMVGVLINTVSAFFFYKGQKNDINIKSAFIHLLVDAFVSVGVVIAGIIIFYTGWNIVDPIISFIIVTIIVVSTYGLLMESLRLTLDGIPKDINYESVKKMLQKHSDIVDVHHIHIWALSSNENALTAHICLAENKYPQEKIMKMKHDIRRRLKDKGIQHVTLEVDYHLEDCGHTHC